jgi:hypothetical protein
MAREELDDPAAWLLTADVADTIGACRVARMVVRSTAGPLVTAQLFSVAAGTVWMVTPRNSVKARVLRRDPRAGILLRAGRRSVVLQGRVEILDPLRPAGLARLALAGGALVIALARYGVRNTDMLAGYATDLLLSPRLDALPYDRVLLGLRVERGMLVGVNTVASSSGDWPGPHAAISSAAPRADTPALPGLPAGVPEAAAALLRDRQAACVGWEGPAGPLALPATWEPSRAVAEVSTAVVERSGAPERSPGCIALDRSPAGRPTRFRGLLLRGPGRLEPWADGDRAACSIDTERVTWWTGFETRSAPVVGLS